MRGWGGGDWWMEDGGWRSIRLCPTLMDSAGFQSWHVQWQETDLSCQSELTRMNVYISQCGSIDHVNHGSKVPLDVVLVPSSECVYDSWLLHPWKLSVILRAVVDLLGVITPSFTIITLKIELISLPLEGTEFNWHSLLLKAAIKARLVG